MRAFRLLAVVVLLPVVAIAQGASSGRSPLVVLSQPENGLSLVAYDPSTASVFSRVFDDADFVKLEPFSLVLRNSSGKSIVGLTVRWSVTDKSAHKEVLDYSTDSFFMIHRPVLSDGSELLVMPGALVPETSGSAGFVGPGKDTIQMMASKFGNSSQATVYVDAVIFDDGMIVGPDESETLAQILARKEAAEEVVAAVRASLAAGEDSTALLEKLASHEPESSKDYLGRWRSQIARKLLHAPNLAAELSRLANVQAPTATRASQSFAAGQGVSTPATTGPKLVTWSCSPSDCLDQLINVYSGIATVNISGICNNGQRPHAMGQVVAYCTLPVTLDAAAYPEKFTYGYDYVWAEAAAYFAAEQYWYMYNISGCDGYYYFFADPPTSC